MEAFDRVAAGGAGRVLVVFESMFGNTEAVARAVAAGLGTAVPTEVLNVTQAPRRIDGVALLVVGAPTHAFGLSRPSTRSAAGEQGGRDDAAAATGIREWIAAVHVARPGIPVATFDTRLRRAPGSAARAARRRLHRRGFDTSVAPVSFHVAGTSGPLRDGELERAEQWGRQLAVAAGRSTAAA